MWNLKPKGDGLEHDFHSFSLIPCELDWSMGTLKSVETPKAPAWPREAPVCFWPDKLCDPIMIITDMLSGDFNNY
jgi:hypothetical protein